MYLQHFGLRHPPLGKEATELWDDGAMAHFSERFAWLLQSPGIGLITGEPGVGKTAALRQITRNINPHRHQVLYQPETDFGRIDIYRGLARALGVEPGYRRAQVWRDLKERNAVSLIGVRHQKAFERFHAFGNPFRIIEPVDGHDQTARPQTCNGLPH